MADRTSPARRCIGCMRSYPQEQLIRLTYDGQRISVDHSGNAPGRGVYFCKNNECIEKAMKNRAFNRNYKKNFKAEETDPVFAELLDMMKEVTNGEKSK